MSGNFANFNAAFPPAGGVANGGRQLQAAPMTFAPQRTAPTMPGAMARELNLRPNEQQLFDSLFYSCDGSRTLGLVSGAAIKTLFTQSRLPKASLATIWNLSDRQKRKVLDLDDFYLACRLISIAQQNLPITMQSVKTYSDMPLPQFEGNALQAGAGVGAQPRKNMPPMTSAGTGLGAGMPGLGVPTQNLGLPVQQPRGVDLLGASPIGGGGGAVQQPGASFPVTLGRAGSIGGLGGGPQQSASPQQDEWSMTETERTQYVSLFSQADADGDGFVGGKEANLFFKQSGLDNATLKQIWLLADVDRDNRLNPDEFSIAMHLTLRVRKKQPLPAVLPASMDPRIKHSPAPLVEEGKKSKLNMDLLPDLLPQASPSADLLGGGGFDAGAPGGRANSKPASRRASTTSADFGAPGGFMQQSQPPVLQSQPSFGFLGGVGGGGAVSGMSTPNAGAGNFAAGFNQPPPSAIPLHQPMPQQPQGYHMIEATQALEDRQTQLQSLTVQTDQVKRNIGQAESRLESKLKQVEQLSGQVQQQEKALEEQRGLLSGIEQQHSQAEATLQDSQKRLAEAQEQLKQGEGKMKQLQEQTQGYKRETAELDMSLTLLESQLTSLRSSLKNIEELKESQFHILQARREQQNALIQEKAEITDLLTASKLELSAIKEQAAIIKDGLAVQQESVAELQEVLKEHREIVKQERIKPSLGMPKQSPPVLSPTVLQSSPTTYGASSNTSSGKSSSSAAKTTAANFSFGEDDDAYNIDDVALPSLGGDSKPTPSPTQTTQPASATSPAAAAPVVTSPATVTSPAASVVPVVSISPSVQASKPIAVTAVKSPFGDDAEDDWGHPPAVAATKPDQTSPFSANSAAQVALPASAASPPTSSAAETIDPFGSSLSIETANGSGPSHRSHTSNVSNVSASSFASPPAPAVPSFPTALEGTGVPDFPSPADSAHSANPWDDADDSNNPFGAPDASAALSPQQAFGEADDPFGGSGAADDPFGASASSGTTQPAAASSAFDDFADFGQPAAPPAKSVETVKPAAPVPTPAAVVEPVPAAAAAAPKKDAVSANFDAAMSEDWAAFD